MSGYVFHVAKCEACRTNFYALDDDTHAPCSKCGEPLNVVEITHEERWDWVDLWQRACSASSAITHGHQSSVGIPAKAAVWLMRRAGVVVKPYGK